MVFAKQWPRALRGFIPEVVGYHLESTDASMSANWFGGKRLRSPTTAVTGESYCSRATQAFLTRFGGRNPFGKPHWRLLVASDRRVKESGVYRDWAPGLSTRGKRWVEFSTEPRCAGLQFFAPREQASSRGDRDARSQKYPHAEGWILERWFPASSYGTQAEWYSYKAVDGFTPMLGPYPECGDYEMIYGPWTKVPASDVLQGLIAQYSAGINNRRGTAASRAQEYLLRYQYDEEQAETKRKAEYEAMMRDHVSPLHSSSLAASRWRQELARRTGNGNEHIGIL